MIQEIAIKGARQHNLKNVSLTLPKEKLIVFTGVSGSGKSSLAFDTIYAEGQRRYVESLSSYARQFLGIMDKPDVDTITGLSPAISIDQKSTTHNPRSTVGTVTEIYDYMRLLFARIGHPHCPSCGREIARMSIDQIRDQIIKLASAEITDKQLKTVRFLVFAPIVRDRKGEFTSLFDNLRSKGITTIRVDGVIYDLSEDIVLIKTNKHTVDAVIDRLVFDHRTLKLFRNAPSDPDAAAAVSGLKTRLHDAVEQALTLSQGLVTVSRIADPGFEMPAKPKNLEDHIFSEKFSCPVCNISIDELEPRTFSFNSPHGACPACTGLGMVLTVDPKLVIAPELTITEGGIIPFSKMFYHDTWYSRLIVAVCQDNGIDPKAPIRTLSADQVKVLLEGTGDKTYIVRGTNRFGENTRIEETYGGVINELVRRLKETQSEYVRSEIEKYMRDEVCGLCQGKRLKKDSLTVTINKENISEVSALNIEDSYTWVDRLSNGGNTILSQSETKIAAPIFKELKARLKFLSDVGLTYLSLDRAARTLSGGEAQRIRLASQIGSGLSGVLYVLDEPSIGLHPRDNDKLISTLVKLKELGNTVIVVEHDRETMEAADYLVDFGPGAGNLGGRITAQGTFNQVSDNRDSVTGQYLSGRRKIPTPAKLRPRSGQSVKLTEVTHNNLKSVDVEFPLGQFICVTGVSGSGKSSLIVDTLYPAVFRKFYPYSRITPGKYGEITGLDNLDKVILIDQSPIGRTPRSNPATYTGIFTHIRDMFSQTSGAKLRGFTPGRFSFNVKGGRCEACEGEGQKKIEMQFLSDVYVTCEVCQGTRYNSETLEIEYRGKNIAQVLDLTFGESIDFFRNHAYISGKVETIVDVGLSYMKLGQPAPTLSGGEAQRVKLATELMRRSGGRTMYILDEPTTGLHFADLEKLLSVLHRLTDAGNTVVVIEHNLDVIKNSDWVIDLGPEGGEAGGKVLAVGTPQEISRNPVSYTGQFLKKDFK